MDAQVSAFFTGGDLIVDLGCGDGQPLDEVSSRYERAIGFDVSAQRFERRQKQRQNWTFVLSDLNQGIPLNSGQASAVHANQVIEHVQNPLFFATEAYRVLKPGGMLVVTTPNVRYLPHLWQLAVRGRGPMTTGTKLRTPTDWDGGHIHFFTPNDLDWIMREAGFSTAHSSALIETSGRFRSLRRLLANWKASRPVKQFLSGNTLMVAVK